MSNLFDTMSELIGDKKPGQGMKYMIYEYKMNDIYTKLGIKPADVELYDWDHKKKTLTLKIRSK